MDRDAVWQADPGGEIEAEVVQRVLGHEVHVVGLGPERPDVAVGEVATVRTVHVVYWPVHTYVRKMNVRLIDGAREVGPTIRIHDPRTLRVLSGQWRESTHHAVEARDGAEPKARERQTPQRCR